MRLWVIRHAAAQSSGPGGDETRPLSAHGRQQAVELAETLRTRVGDALIVCSPALRARQTADALIRAHAGTSLVEAAAVSTSGSVEDALIELRVHAKAEMLIVSHEPLVSQLVSTLATDGHKAHVRFLPGTAVLLEGDDVLRPHSMRRRDVIVPGARDHHSTSRTRHP